MHCCKDSWRAVGQRLVFAGSIVGRFLHGSISSGGGLGFLGNVAASLAPAMLGRCWCVRLARASTNCHFRLFPRLFAATENCIPQLFHGLFVLSTLRTPFTTYFIGETTSTGTGRITGLHSGETMQAMHMLCLSHTLELSRGKAFLNLKSSYTTMSKPPAAV